MHANDHTVEAELLSHFVQLEEDLWRAETRFDDSYMERLFAPDFFEFGRSGKAYKRADMFFESQGLSEIAAEFPLPNFTARYLSEDVVQTTYVSKVTRGKVAEFANRSSIWTRSLEGWKLRFHQGTPTNKQNF